jgi:glycosyltransferase involved in cell wall biosynthesis
VVAAASRGPAALIRDHADGRLVPVDDAGALAEAVRGLIDDSSLRKRLAAMGLRRVAAEFSQDAVVARWRALLSDLGAG